MEESALQLIPIAPLKAKATVALDKETTVKEASVVLLAMLVVVLLAV
jgi:hypothetical protein